MNDIKFFKRNSSESFINIQSAVVPTIGSIVWVDGGTENYVVDSILYNVCASRRRLIIEIIVK